MSNSSNELKKLSKLVGSMSSETQGHHCRDHHGESTTQKRTRSSEEGLTVWEFYYTVRPDRIYYTKAD